MEKVMGTSRVLLSQEAASAELERKVRAIVPAAFVSKMQRDQGFQSKIKPGLLVSLLLHAALLGGFAWVAQKAPLPEVKEVPMTVSLLSEIPEAPIVDKQPAPEPVQKPMTPKPQPVKKPLNQPKLQQVVEQPLTPTVTDTPSPVVAATSVASTPTQETVAESKPAETIAKAPVEKPTPKEDVTEPPKFGVAYLNNPKPKYPRLSKSAGEEGRVLFKVLVNENGDAESVEMTTSSGYERLDNAAMEAVQQWKFVPAKRNNQAISAYVTVPISFKLD